MPRLLLTMLASALFCAMLVTAGCKSSVSHTSNPQLKQIDELVNQQLPPGTPMSKVSFFLNSRGYPSERSSDPRAIVATIEHVDTETLRPSAARVTFRFDANDKLLTYDMTPAMPTAVH
jgi:hypothetical protein